MSSSSSIAKVIADLNAVYIGPIPVRRELRDMKKNFPDQWNLYLLGLERFKQVDEKEPLSFFQIAG